MKNLFAVIVVMLFVSSCIKVEDDIVNCDNKPDTPVLSATNDYDKNLGDTLKLTITNFNPLLTYTTYLPDGTVFPSSSGPLILSSTAMAGNYSIEANGETALCASDKANFNVTVNEVLPTCLTGSNLFKLGTNSTVNMSTGDVRSQFYYYDMFWVNGNPQLTVSFHYLPSKTATQVYRITNSSSPEYFEDDECSVRYYNGFSTSYNALSGTVFVKYESGAYHVVFCNLRMYGGGGYLNNCMGDLFSYE